MLVGMAPGTVELKYKRPFIGPAGRELDKALRTNMLDRGQMYVTNVVKRLLPKNDISPLVNFRARPPRGTKAWDEWVELLKTEIIQVKPNLIVAFGNVALYALTGEHRISLFRGSILESTLVPGVKVLASLHPSAILRDPKMGSVFRWDLRKIREQQDSPSMPRDLGMYYIRPSFGQVMDYLDECMSNIHGFDIECSRGAVTCISFSYADDHAISIPFTDGTSDYWDPVREAAVLRKITEVLENPKTPSIAHNSAFDVTFLFQQLGIRTACIEDTMIAMGVLHPQFRKSLAFMVSLYTDMPYYKEDGKDTIHGTAVANDDFWLYNARDSIALMRAWPKLVADLDRMKNWETYARQRDLIPALTYMSTRGIKMDTEGMAQRKERIELEIEVLQGALDDHVGYPLNVASPAQVKDYFYGVKRLTPYKEKGRVSTAEKALIQIGRKGYEEAFIILDIRKRRKLLGTYYGMGLDPDKRLRCSYDPVGTAFGRLSSRKTIRDTGANLQNQPPAMKKFMLVDDGYVGYEIDLSQAENRVVAYLGPDDAMINAFSNGLDIHSLTALSIASVWGEDITIAEARDKNVVCPIGQGQFNWRYWGKRANHALNYGMGVRKAALLWEISEAEAQSIVSAYNLAYPGVERFHRRVRDAIYKLGYLVNLFGRRARFGGRAQGDTLNQALSFIPQSTVADIINHYGIRAIIADEAGVYTPLDLLNQVHDSLVFQLPGQDWEQQKLILDTLVNDLTVTLQHNGYTFTIPCEIKMFRKNFGTGRELPDSPTAAQLAETYDSF